MAASSSWVFEGVTINAPSMPCVEDYLDTLGWGEIDRRAQGHHRALGRQRQGARRLGGSDALGRPSRQQRGAAVEHVGVLEVIDPAVTKLSADEQAVFAKTLAGLLEKEGVAYDIAYYRDAPPGLRIWCGATVETSDVKALTSWLDWAFAEAKAVLPKAA